MAKDVAMTVVAEEEAGYIKPDDWTKMSREERDSVLEARGTKRKVEALQTVHPTVPNSVPTGNATIISQITTDASTAPTGNASNQAGQQFGRAAHRG
jgi:hypothetical protein